MSKSICAVIASNSIGEILPVGISGASKKDRNKFGNKLIVNIGKPIPYNENVDEMIKVWVDEVNRLVNEAQ